MNVKDVVIGVDYGTDSVRSLIVDARTGREISSAVHEYTRWKKGLYCDSAKNRFRQHPLDYVEGLEKSVRKALAAAPRGTAALVRGLSVDTTGSTPCAVDAEGTPLALKKEFVNNPNAMFVLWKDHTAIAEAEEINRLCHTGRSTDYTKYVGGIYSSEWFWAKILHILRSDDRVRRHAVSWVEHCDWIPALLTGVRDVRKIFRSRCAAGHKALWHEEFGGLPAESFLVRLDSRLKGLRANLYQETQTADRPAGRIAKEWADRLGLSAETVIGTGAFDAHMGAVGGGIGPYELLKVIGTSTCDILVAPNRDMKGKLVRGICGQVDGSVLPGMLGMEAGQSAFGDIYAWFRDLLVWPLRGKIRNQSWKELEEEIIPRLSREADRLPVDPHGVLAVDWMNGRRTPDANQALKGALSGLNLASSAPVLFRALVESTAFGAKRIVDRFVAEGVPVRSVIAIGGVARKSSFVMQTLADVFDMPIRVARSGQACALGAAMFAAVAAGLYRDVAASQKAIFGGFEKTYTPRRAKAVVYAGIYQRYLRLCAFIEAETGKGKNK